jgi:membrane-bound metal-dependent hydrolase YbcI (DUF457 family)
MQLRTHIAGIILFIILLISHVSNGIIFATVCLIATFIPDIDTKFSTLGKKKIFRPIQIFLKHRGMFHSFTFLLIITVLFALFVPIIALPFFLGYGVHLLLDGFTVDGIAPFYPYKKKTYGNIRNGSKLEGFIFVTFIIIDLALLLLRFSNIS